MGHNTGSEHQEAADRIEAIVNEITTACEPVHPIPQDGIPHHHVKRLRFATQEMKPILRLDCEAMLTEEQVNKTIRLAQLAHSSRYLKSLQEICDTLTDEDVVPLTPRLLPEAHQTSSATRISRHSFQCALTAVSVVTCAIDFLMNNGAHAAFCLVRPPGHHASYDGPIPSVGSCGFCLINNVAVAAAYARHHHHLDRVVVIDIDVHHGNGTEDIFHRLGSGYMYCSVHLYQVFADDSNHDFFPGTGAGNTVTENKKGAIICNCPLTPLYDSPHHKSSSTTTKTTCGRQSFRAAFEQQIIPAVQEFNPELVLLSSGFDGALGDIGNMCEEGIKPGLDLEPADYWWISTKLKAAFPNVRLCSVLEGGYGKFDEYEGFDRSLLVECVMEHVRGMME